MDLEKIMKQLQRFQNVQAFIKEAPDTLTARDKSGNTLLHLTMLNEEYDLAKMLIEHNAYPLIYNENRDSAYSLVVRTNNAKLLQLLIAQYPNSLTASEQVELLALATINGQYGQLKLMLEAGFAINEGYEESSLAEWAAQAGRLDIMELIHSYGAPMDQPNEHGETPLHQAAAKGSVEIVRHLIGLGVDINRPTKNGLTPLMSACTGGQKEIVALLLENSADVKCKDKDGKTALEYAEKKENAKIIGMLKQKLPTVPANKSAVAEKKPAPALPPLTYPIYLARTYPDRVDEVIVYSFGYSPDNLVARFGVNLESHEPYGINTKTIRGEAFQIVQDRLREFVMAQPERKYPQKLVIEKDGVQDAVLN